MQNAFSADYRGRLGHDVHLGDPALDLHGIAEDALQDHLAIMDHQSYHALHDLVFISTFQGINRKFAHTSSKIEGKTDPAGFEPATPGLEARCYILAKPRVRELFQPPLGGI